MIDEFLSIGMNNAPCSDIKELAERIKSVEAGFIF